MGARRGNGLFHGLFSVGCGLPVSVLFQQGRIRPPAVCLSHRERLATARAKPAGRPALALGLGLSPLFWSAPRSSLLTPGGSHGQSPPPVVQPPSPFGGGVVFLFVKQGMGGRCGLSRAVDRNFIAIPVACANPRFRIRGPQKVAVSPPEHGPVPVNPFHNWLFMKAPSQRKGGLPRVSLCRIRV